MFAQIKIRSPLIAHHMNNKRPAVKKRIATINKAGISSIATRMKKYVDPQTIYTIANAITTFKGGTGLEFSVAISYFLGITKLCSSLTVSNTIVVFVDRILGILLNLFLIRAISEAESAVLTFTR